MMSTADRLNRVQRYLAGARQDLELLVLFDFCVITERYKGFSFFLDAGNGERGPSVYAYSYSYKKKLYIGVNPEKTYKKKIDKFHQNFLTKPRSKV